MAPAALSRAYSLRRSSWRPGCRQQADPSAAAPAPSKSCRTHTLRCSCRRCCSNRYSDTLGCHACQGNSALGFPCTSFLPAPSVTTPLVNVQGLGVEEAGSGKKAATAAAKALLAVVQSAMAPGAFAAALVAISCQPDNAGPLRRKSLKLLAAAAERTGQELAAADALQRQALATTSQAALAFCAQLSSFFVPGA